MCRDDTRESARLIATRSARAVLLLEVPKLPIQRLSLDTQDPGSGSLVPLNRVEHVHDIATFNFFHAQELGRITTRNDHVGAPVDSHPLRQIVDAEFTEAGQRDTTLHAILKLANVSRPGVGNSRSATAGEMAITSLLAASAKRRTKCCANGRMSVGLARKGGSSTRMTLSRKNKSSRKRFSSTADSISRFVAAMKRTSIALSVEAPMGRTQRS